MLLVSLFKIAQRRKNVLQRASLGAPAATRGAVSGERRILTLVCVVYVKVQKIMVAESCCCDEGIQPKLNIKYHEQEIY